MAKQAPIKFPEPNEDAYWGVGGEYVRDPQTGARMPREQWDALQTAPATELKEE